MSFGQIACRPYSSFRASKPTQNLTINTPSSPVVARSTVVSSSARSFNASRNYRKDSGDHHNSQLPAIKPLTPKLCRRIESYSSNTTSPAKNFNPLAPVTSNHQQHQQQPHIMKSRTSTNFGHGGGSGGHGNMTTSNSNGIVANKRGNSNSITNGYQHHHTCQLHSKSSPNSSSEVSIESIMPKYGVNSSSYYTNGGAAGNRNHAGTGAFNGSQKRAYNTVKVSKENVPTSYYRSTNNSQRITTMHNNYTNQNQRHLNHQVQGHVGGKLLALTGGSSKKKYKEHISSSNSSTNSSPVEYSNKLSNQRSHRNNVPAFSSKFPNGLPFEDEFYRRRRSYSQSSSNYSIYSVATTNQHSNNMSPKHINGHNDVDDDEEVYNDADLVNNHHDYNDEDDEDGDGVDDEFTRKPSNEPLYVDFSKTIQRSSNNDVNGSVNSRSTHLNHQSYNYHNNLKHNDNNNYNNKRNNPNGFNYMKRFDDTTTTYNSQQHDYFYKFESVSKSGFNTNNEIIVTTTKGAHPAHQQQQDKPVVYVAMASWVPKCNQHLPPTVTNKDGGGGEVEEVKGNKARLEPTKKNNDHDRSSRRRAERSKRSHHRRSPTSGRRGHRHRHRDERSHSTSRRRHRDRERAKEREDRITPAKNRISTYDFPVLCENELSQHPTMYSCDQPKIYAPQISERKNQQDPKPQQNAKIQLNVDNTNKTVEPLKPPQSPIPPALPPKSSSSTRVNFYNSTNISEIKPNLMGLTSSPTKSAVKSGVAGPGSGASDEKPTILGIMKGDAQNRPIAKPPEQSKQRSPSLSISLSSSTSSSSCSPPPRSVATATPPAPSAKSASAQALSEIAKMLNSTENLMQSRIPNQPVQNETNAQKSYKTNFKCPPDKDNKPVTSAALQTQSQRPSQQQLTLPTSKESLETAKLSSDIYNADIDYMNKYLRSLPDYNELDKKIHKEFKKCEDLYDQLKSINDGIAAQKNQLAKSSSQQSIGSTFGGSNRNLLYSAVVTAPSSQNKLTRSTSSIAMSNPKYPLDHPEIRGFIPKIDRSGVNEQQDQPPPPLGPKKSGVQKSASHSCISLRPMGKQLMNAFWSNNVNVKDSNKPAWNYEKIVAGTAPPKRISAPRTEPEPYKLQKNKSMSQMDCRTQNQNMIRVLPTNQPSQPNMQQQYQCQPPGFMNLNKSISYSNVPQVVKSSSRTHIPCYARPTISTLNKSCSNTHLPSSKPAPPQPSSSTTQPQTSSGGLCSSLKGVMKSSSSSAIFNTKQPYQPFFIRRKDTSNVSNQQNTDSKENNSKIATATKPSSHQQQHQQHQQQPNPNHKPQQEQVTSYICNIFKKPTQSSQKDNNGGSYMPQVSTNVVKQGPTKSTTGIGKQTPASAVIPTDMMATKKQKDAENNIEKRLNEILRMTTNFNQQNKEKNVLPLKKSNSTSAVPQTFHPSIFKQPQPPHPQQQQQATHQQRFIKRPTTDTKSFVGPKIAGSTHQNQMKPAAISNNKSQHHYQHQAAAASTDSHEKTRPITTSNSNLATPTAGIVAKGSTAANIISENNTSNSHNNNKPSGNAIKYNASGQTANTNTSASSLSTSAHAPPVGGSSGAAPAAQKNSQMHQQQLANVGKSAATNATKPAQAQLNGNGNVNCNNTNPYYDDNVRSDILRTFDPYFYPKPKQHQQQPQAQQMHQQHPPPRGFQPQSQLPAPPHMPPQHPVVHYGPQPQLQPLQKQLSASSLIDHPLAVGSFNYQHQPPQQQFPAVAAVGGANLNHQRNSKNSNSSSHNNFEQTQFYEVRPP